MHCNLMLPDIMPVILCFNYNAHNVQAYKFNNSTTSAVPYCTHTLNLNTSQESATELLRLKYVQFGRRLSSWI